MADDGASQSDDGSGKDDKGAGSSSDATYKVVVDGAEVEVKLDELLAGYSRQQDYTRKTQGLSDKEKRIDELVNQRAEALLLDLSKEAKEKGQNGGGEGDGDDAVGKLKAEIQTLTTRIEQGEKSSIDKQSDAELDIHLKGIIEKFPKADKDKVLVRFYNECKETDDVGEFFARVGEEQHKLAIAYDQKIIDDYVARKTANPFSSGEGGHSSAQTGKPAEPVKTFKEARERAEQRLETLGGR